MARRLLRHTVSITTGVILTAAIFFGVGHWRRSQDTGWCGNAAVGGVVAGDQDLTPDVLEEVRAACIVQRQRQRGLFGAVWRTGGEETARCGFELARMQLISYRSADGYEPILRRYGINDAHFDISSREHRDRFVRACLAGGEPQAE